MRGSLCSSTHVLTVKIGKKEKEKIVSLRNILDEAVTMTNFINS